jgi:Na+-translocating ferredoxin:NAD+ oxidoreductase RNF subunit RnfB
MINGMDILIAFGVVAGVALILGVLLALISRFFAVEEDETVKAVRACLPGVNCGACGYKGCDDYAAAVADGSAKPNLCVPGAEVTAAELGALLGVEVEAPKDVVAYVHCNGHCEATSKKASYDGVSTCRAASMLYGGPDACRFGCIGLGDCAAACPAGAICLMDGVAHVDTSLCLGCGLCVTVCPKHIISTVPQETEAVVACSNTDKGADARKACKNACIGCKKCEKVCPSGAIVIENNLARIDYEKCTGCGTCDDVCPTGCMKQVVFPDLPEGVHPRDLINRTGA